MMEEEIDKMGSNDSMFMNMTKENCKENCTNEVCLGPEDYEYYLSFVKVDDFEMVFVILNVIVFLTGIMGNLLVSMTDISLFKAIFLYRKSVESLRFFFQRKIQKKRKFNFIINIF